MKHHLSTPEAAILLEILGKIKNVTRKSAVIATLVGIDKHELQRIEALITRLGKNEIK